VQKVARFPCDNCGQIGHWSYSMECPNYDAYLAKQKAKSVVLRKSGGSGGAGGGKPNSGIMALRNNPVGLEKRLFTHPHKLHLTQARFSSYNA